MSEPMKTSGPRLALLFRQAGLLAESDWQKRFAAKSAQSKSLKEILLQDVSWQTFADLAMLEIRLPSRKSRAEAALPAALTQALQISRGEMFAMLQKHQPDIRKLCDALQDANEALRPTIEELLKTDSSPADLYRQLLDREILTSDLLSRVVEKGSHPLARRNREILALEILALNHLIPTALRDELLPQIEKPVFSLALELADRKAVTSAQIAQAAENGMNLPTVDLGEVKPDPAMRDFCPIEFVRRELTLPMDGDRIVRLAIADPLNLSIADSLSILTGRMILLCYAPPADIISAINRVYVEAPAVSDVERIAPQPAAPAVSAPPGAPEKTEAPAPPAPAAAPPPAEPKTPAPKPAVAVTRIVDSMSTVELVSSIIESAVATRATDIHLEPQAQGSLRVRFRIDGTLHSVMNVPAHLALPVISRVKVLANMNVTERRRPQDGHFSLELESRAFDFRVSAMPSHLGEKLVLRVLEQATVLKGLGDLGLSEDQQKQLSRLISRPYGLLLVTGPTGSGKTTTLYSALSTVNRPDINIITIEDPVESQLEGITQVQVDYAIEMDFASGLRAALRQDPDIIMVGEIRDHDTARIAIRAALTGHMVFSTLHTNYAVGAVTALHHMGIQPYLTASAMAGAVAQRLVKKICPECRQPIRITKSLIKDLGLDENTKRKMYRGKGCSNCLNTGYSGRVGVFEIFRVNDPIRYLIMDLAPEARLMEAAREDGFVSLRDHALEKVFEGITSPDEVLRTVFLSD
ncbi:MAG: GspE/PulE family protein [Candidatus Sumerlaeia bacterium]|nr:GspE/PulE family protein [Candidatus Sumerlaeia bacterium]